MTNANTYQDFITGLSLSQPASGDWVQDRRSAAYERFQQKGFPTKKEEAWRYTSFEKVLKSSFLPTSKLNIDFPCPEQLNDYHGGNEEKNRMVFINNAYNESYSSQNQLSKRAIFNDLSAQLKSDPEKLKPYFALNADEEDNAFVSINTFSFRQGVFISIPARERVELPIHLLFAGMGDNNWPTVFYPRLVVALEEGASLNLLMNHVSTDDEAYFMNAVGEFHLGSGSNLNFTLSQRQTEQASQFFSGRFWLQENSNLEIRSFVQGGNVNHNEFKIEFMGEHAACDVQGLTLLNGASQTSQGIWANHRVSNCTSRQTFKNILADYSRAEFNSTAYVFSGTKGSCSNQLNRNLLLSDNARAYSRPQLRIDADDVSASHGSTTGQLEEKELFYLQSRGFSLEESKSLLTFGFAEEILETFKSQFLKEQLEALVRSKLETILK